MKMKNLNGTSEKACKCDSWLDHWQKYSQQQLPVFCAENKCMDPPEVGAHVQKDDPSDTSWYIVPLCRKHNAQRGASLEIDNSVNLAPANVSKTCGQAQPAKK